MEQLAPKCDTRIITQQFWDAQRLATCTTPKRNAQRLGGNCGIVSIEPYAGKSGKPELVSGFLLLKGQVGRGTRSKAGALPCDEGGVVK